MAGIKPHQITLLTLLPLALGWFLSLFFFGKYHTDVAREGVSPSAAGTYVDYFLQFWVFTLATPALAVLVVLNAFKNNFVLGLITGVVAAVTAVALGGCLTITIRIIDANASDNPYFAYAGTSLAGELLAMLALFGLIGLLSSKMDDGYRNLK